MKKEKNKGFIALSRKILDWQHFNEPHYLMVFVTLMLTANHSPRWWKGIEIKRGQTVISVRSLASLCGLSQPTIIKVLKGLQKSGEIKRTKLKKLNTLTSIVKYDDYQVGYKSSSKNFLATSLAEQQLNSNILLTTSSKYNNIGQHEKILNDMLKGGILLEGFCKAEGITQSQFEKLAREVINDWAITGKTHVNERDARQHLLNHVRAIIRSRNIVSDNREKRLAPLINDCKSLISQGYPIDDVREFYSYWTQPCNDRSGRMLFESVKAFDAVTKFLSFFKRKKS